MTDAETIQTIQITREPGKMYRYRATASKPEIDAHGEDAGEALLNLLEKLYPDAKYRRSGINIQE